MYKKAIKILVLSAISLNSGTLAFAYPTLYDDVPESYLSEKKSVKTEYKNKIFEDETAKQLGSIKRAVYIRKEFTDKAFPASNQVKNNKIQYVPLTFTEKPVPQSEMLINFKRPVYNAIIDFDKGIPVEIKPMRDYKSTYSVANVTMNGKSVTAFFEKPLIGTKVAFFTTQNVYKNGELFIPSGQRVEGFIGYSQPSDSGGTEGKISAERFRTNDVNGNIINLSGRIENSGIATGGMTYLAGYALVPLTFGISSLLVALPGTGGAIKVKKTYTIYYKPEIEGL